MVFYLFIFIPSIFLWANRAPTKQRPSSNKQINLSAAYVNKSPKYKREKTSKRKDKGGKNMTGVGGGDSEVTCQK